MSIKTLYILLFLTTLIRTGEAPTPLQTSRDLLRGYSTKLILLSFFSSTVTISWSYPSLPGYTGKCGRTLLWLCRGDDSEYMQFILGLGAIRLGVSLVPRCVSQRACVHILGSGEFIVHLCCAVCHSECVCTSSVRGSSLVPRCVS